MSMENLGPYTNYHELNQDWFLQEFNKLIAQWKAMQKNFDNVQDAFNDLKSYVEDYFKNLDVQDEINNKLDEMYNNGLFEVLLNKRFNPALANFSMLSDRTLKPKRKAPIPPNNSIIANIILFIYKIPL